MPDIQTVIDVFLDKGLLRADELQRKRERVEDSLKLVRILTEEELDAVAVAVNALVLPAPTGWAHALYLHGQRSTQAAFSPHRVYCACCLRNLAALLYKADLKNPRIFRKLQVAALKAERYGVGHAT